MRMFFSFILAFFLILPASAQVCQCHGDNSQGKSVADSIWTISQSHPDGFTVNVRTWTMPEEGICVAYSTTQSSHGRDNLDEIVAHATRHEGFVGGWLDRSDSLYYFDSVRIFPEDSLSAAISFGKSNRQKAVYRLSTGEEIILKKYVEDVSPTNLIILYDPEIGKGPLVEAIRATNAEIIYDYSIIPGMALSIPNGADIHKWIDYLKTVKGVVSVERDRINHLVEPVKPRLETM